MVIYNETRQKNQIKYFDIFLDCLRVRRVFRTDSLYFDFFFSCRSKTEIQSIRDLKSNSTTNPAEKFPPHA